MKKFALGSLLLGSVLGAGCEVEVIEDYADGVVTASVTLVNAGPGSLGACQPDNDAIRIVFDDGAHTELFNCDATSIETTVQPGGAYSLRVEYVHDNFTVDPNDDSVVGATGDLDFILDGDVALDVDLTMDHGFLQLGWLLESEAGDPLDCADVVGENGIGILATLSGTADATDTKLNCSDALGTTQPVPLGDLEVEVTVLDAADLALGASDIIPATVDNGNEYVDIGDIAVVVFN